MKEPGGKKDSLKPTASPKRRARHGGNAWPCQIPSGGTEWPVVFRPAALASCLTIPSCSIEVHDHTVPVLAGDLAAAQDTPPSKLGIQHTETAR